MRSVSVIVPTYNREKTIGLTLESLVSQDYPADCLEIIVVNNNSTDKTAAVVNDLAKKHSLIKCLDEDRQGVHYARNGVIKAAKGEILYYTDDDMIAEPDLLKKLVAVFDNDPAIASVGGRVLPRWEISPPDWILKYCYNGYLSLNPDDTPLIISSKMLPIYSCHQAILKTAILEAGGFNPENTKGEWIGDGETGLLLKILKLGYKLAYCGESVTHHIIPNERLTQSYLNRRFGNQGNCDSYTTYQENNGLSKVQLRSNIIGSIRDLLRNLRSALWNLLKSNDVWRLSMAKVFYHRNRILYDLRLMRNTEWRQLVLRRNWID